MSGLVNSFIFEGSGSIIKFQNKYELDVDVSKVVYLQNVVLSNNLALVIPIISPIFYM